MAEGNVVLDDAKAAWLDCGANDQYISDHSVLEIYKPLEYQAVDTCAGKRKTVREGNATLQLDKEI